MEEWIEVVDKTVDDAITTACAAMDVTSDELVYEVIEKETKGLLGMFSKPAKIRYKRSFTIEEVAKKFLEEVLDKMELEAKVNIKYDEEKKNMDVDLVGDDMGILIGKRGQTLDSLQYLLSLVVNKEQEGYIKVKVDTENYRERRKDTLENLANNIAHKVKRTRRAVTLEPMNPYERRIIHSALQNDKYCDTHSEGGEPYRKVVITPKKGLKDFSSRRNNYNRDSNYRKDYKKKFSDSYKKSFQSISLDDVRGENANQ